MFGTLKLLVLSQNADETWPGLQQIRSLFPDLSLEFARDRRSAVRCIRQRPHLILADLEMPEMDPERIADTLAEYELTIPVLLLATSGNESAAVRTVIQGLASDYVLTDATARLPIAVNAVIERMRMQEHSNQMVERLRESQEQYRFLIENVIDVITVTDINATILYESPSLERVLGFKPEELVGTNAFSNIHPLDIPKTMPIFMLAMATPGVPHSTRLRFRHKNGSWRQLEVVGKVIRDAEQGIRLIVTSRDISDRERAQEALGQSETRFRAVVEGLSEGLVITNMASEVSYFNSRMTELTGYTPQEVLGKPFYKLIIPESYWQDRANWIADKSPDRPSRFETQIRRKDGSLVWMEILTTPYRDGEETVGTISAFVDISERKRIAEQLEQERLEAIEARKHAEEMNRLKSSFLANMSHEIRTPMTSILGFAHLLRDSLQDEELRLYANMIHSGGSRLLDTLNGLLDLASIEAGVLRVNAISSDLCQAVANVVEQLRPLAEGKLLTVTTQIPDKPVYAIIDPHLFRESLKHILNNAIKFTEMGRVDVVINIHDDERVAVEVHDTGVGISEEFLPLIYDPFKQESAGLDRRFEGNGLGLTLTKHMVDIMNGGLSVQSEKGRGSVFSLEFAIAATPPAQPSYRGSIFLD